RFLPLFVRAIRPPPMFTVFPYTTLFRSENTSLELADRQIHFFAASHGARQPLSVRGTPAYDVHNNPIVACEASICAAGATLLFEDRKSTRLNSSHVKTSYAVFCLKKKTN